MEQADQQKLVKFLAAKAAATRIDNLDETGCCVAHVYAAAVLLVGAGAYPDEASPPEVHDLETALKRIASLEGTEPREELCKLLLETLALFERWLLEKVPRGFGPLLRSPFRLEDLAQDADPARSIMTGRVDLWEKPPSAFARLRRLRNGGNSKGPPAPPLDPSFVTERVGYYWHSDPRLPAATPIPENVKASKASRSFVLQSGPDFESGRFRICLCPLLPDCHPIFSISSARSFAVDRQNLFLNSAKLTEHIDALLERAATEQIHLLVMPELAVPGTSNPDAGRDKLNDVRGHLIEKLQETAGRANPSLFPYGVIAGSFHIWRDGDAPPVNESIFFSRVGARILHHHKRGRFRITSKQASEAGALFSSGPGDPERDNHDIVEGITYGTQLQFFDSGLGRLAVLICADAIAADPFGCIPVVERLRPDILFVVAMTPETDKFEAAAESLAGHGISTIFVNARCVVRSRTNACLAFSHLSLYEPADGRAPPGRLKWMPGTDPVTNGGGTEVEELQYFQRRGAKGWRAVPAGDEARCAASWLEIGGARAGLILDLGAQLRRG